MSPGVSFTRTLVRGGSIAFACEKEIREATGSREISRKDTASDFEKSRSLSLGSPACFNDHSPRYSARLLRSQRPRQLARLLSLKEAVVYVHEAVKVELQRRLRLRAEPQQVAGQQTLVDDRLATPLQEG